MSKEGFYVAAGALTIACGALAVSFYNLRKWKQINGKNATILREAEVVTNSIKIA